MSPIQSQFVLLVFDGSLDSIKLIQSGSILRHSYAVLVTLGDEIYDMRCLFVAVGLIPLYNAISLDNMSYAKTAIQMKTGLRGEPTESIDGNYHRNKTIKYWSNGITCLYRKCMVLPLKYHFFIENRLLDFKMRQMVKSSSQYIENKCSH